MLHSHQHNMQLIAFSFFHTTSKLWMVFDRIANIIITPINSIMLLRIQIIECTQISRGSYCLSRFNWSFFFCVFSLQSFSLVVRFSLLRGFFVFSLPVYETELKSVSIMIFNWFERNIHVWGRREKMNTHTHIPHHNNAFEPHLHL